MSPHPKTSSVAVRTVAALARHEAGTAATQPSIPHARPQYSPENPPRLRRPDESVEDYRKAMGWERTSQWHAAAWSCHAKTAVLVDDPTAPTGKHVIAECDTEEHARLLAAAPQLLATLELIEQVTRGRKLAADDCKAILSDIGKAARAVIALVQP